MQAQLLKTPRRGYDFARIGNISIFQSHAQPLEACACARTRNYESNQFNAYALAWLGLAALK
jgi:hypothetical protein